MKLKLKGYTEPLTIEVERPDGDGRPHLLRTQGALIKSAEGKESSEAAKTI